MMKTDVQDASRASFHDDSVDDAGARPIAHASEGVCGGVLVLTYGLMQNKGQESDK
jgi:hypothetical protein